MCLLFNFEQWNSNLCQKSIFIIQKGGRGKVVMWPFISLSKGSPMRRSLVQLLPAIWGDWSYSDLHRRILIQVIFWTVRRLHESKASDLEVGWEPNAGSRFVSLTATGRQKSYFIIIWISLKPLGNRHGPKCHSGQSVIQPVLVIVVI